MTMALSYSFSSSPGLSSLSTVIANQFRLFIHSAAYILMHALRENLLHSSELAKAQFDTIRLRLLKIGTRVEIGKTFIRFHFPACYPMQPLLFRATTVLNALNSS